MYFLRGTLGTDTTVRLHPVDRCTFTVTQGETNGPYTVTNALFWDGSSNAGQTINNPELVMLSTAPVPMIVNVN